MLCVLAIGTAINYATERAKLDPRTDGHRFENFGLILTYGKVGAQEVHIDLANKEHLQCALIANSGNYATSEYVCTDEPVVTTAQCLTRIWPAPTPVSLIEKIGSNEASVLLLKAFGSLLGQCRKRNKDGKRSGKTEIGTVTTCPGTVPHCGPVSTNMRMVLFFTSTPKDAVESYDVDTQYTKLGVCADLVTENWTQFNGDKRFLGGSNTEVSEEYPAHPSRKDCTRPDLMQRKGQKGCSDESCCGKRQEVVRQQPLVQCRVHL